MRVSFDTNILIYSIDGRDPDKEAAAQDLIRRAARVDCVLPLQSLAEFFRAATVRHGMAPRAARNHVEDFRRAFPVVLQTLADLDSAIKAVEEHGLSFWDAMLWAVVRAAGCALLLTEDMQDGRVLGGVRFVDPFLKRNAALVDAALPRP